MFLVWQIFPKKSYEEKEVWANYAQLQKAYFKRNPTREILDNLRTIIETARKKAETGNKEGIYEKEKDFKTPYIKSTPIVFLIFGTRKMTKPHNSLKT